MKRLTIAVGGALTLALLLLAPASETLAAANEGPRSASLVNQKFEIQNRLMESYTLDELKAGVYVGSEVCISCHQGFRAWRDTKHAQALRRPLAQYSLIPGKGVVADYDGNGVDDFIQGLNFNQISSAFNPYKPNAPVLSYENGGYFITIGQLRMPVISTQGGTGDWKQRYLVRVPVTGTPQGLSMENYVSPVQFNEVTGEYVTYHPEQWWDTGSGAPLYGPGTAAAQLAQTGRSYSQKCIGCHTSGIRDLKQDANGEWRYTPYPAGIFSPDDPGYFDYDHDGIFDIVNVGCESCHGPGSAHVVGAGDPRKIVNPANLSPEMANEVCGQCHSRVKSVPNGTHDWPYLDDVGEQWKPGNPREPLAAYFTDNSGRWPDGIHSRQHHQQYLDFLESPKPGFAFHPVVCNECHDPHGFTGNEHQILDEVVQDGVRIATDINDNTLCLACHATHGPFADITPEMVADYETFEDDIAPVVAAHTNHPWGPERLMGLSRCTECHMPKIARSAISYDIASHVFEAIAPEKTLRYQDQGGMPSSCAVSCHGTKVDLFAIGLDPDISNWSQSFDKRNARFLEMWFGPGGIWWDTSAAGATFDNLLEAAAPGEYQPPFGYDEEE